MKAAELYERYPARYILGPWAPLLVDAACLAAGERVLDVACGTGVVARAASKRIGPTGRVVGVDLNSGMISVARRFPQQVMHQSNGWSEARSIFDWKMPALTRFFASRDYSSSQIRRSHCAKCAVCLIVGAVSPSAFGIAIASALTPVP